jgi:hypothetical protein
MSEESWDEQFKQFLRKTGDDFRRAGEEVRAEAQRLLDAAMDPQKQQRVRDRLNELSLWARKTAQGVAGAMEGAATKAETAFHSATDKVMEARDKMRGSETSSAAGETKAPAPRSRAGGKKSGGAKAKPGKTRPKSGGKRKR